MVSYSEAIEKVLETNGDSMGYKEITKEVLKIKDDVKGKNPESTIIATIMRDKKGKFKKLGRGVYGLSSDSNGKKESN